MKVNITLADVLDRKNMSQRELARITEIRPMSINEMCQNKIKRLPLDHLAKICETLDCSITDILELVPDPK